MQPLDLVFRYRVLKHKCDVGLGLDFAEIDELAALEAGFAPGVDDTGSDGRRFARAALATSAIIRGIELNDRAIISDLGPGGLACAGIPAATVGEVLDVVFDDGGPASLRLKAKVQWVRPTADGLASMGLAFVGAPVRIHYRRKSMPASEMFDALPTKHAA